MPKRKLREDRRGIPALPLMPNSAGGRVSKGWRRQEHSGMLGFQCSLLPREEETRCEEETSIPTSSNYYLLLLLFLALPGGLRDFNSLTRD